MTELLLICVVGAIGVGFATRVRRWLLQRPRGEDDFIRAAALVSDGVTRYLKRQNIVAASLAAVVGASVLLVYGIAYQTDTQVLTAVSPREFGVWTTASYTLGAGFALLASWVAAWAGKHANAAVANGARRSLDEPLQIAIRAGGIAGVTALALAVLGLAGLFLALYAYNGGFSESERALAMAPRMPLLMSGFALGAAFVALLAQLGGGVFGDVADIGADVAGKLGASLSEDAPGNPALVADLVGDTVGDGAAWAASVLATTVIELLGAMLVAALVYQHNSDLPSVTAVVLFPLVARIFSLITAWFGVMVVRTDDREVPMNALSRGLYVSTLLHAVAIIGTAKWLLGSHWLPYGICTALGCAVSLAFLHVVQYFSEQKYRPVRALAEAARAGATLAVLRGLLAALAAGLTLLGVLAVAVGGAYAIGASSGLTGGGLLGLAMLLSGMLGSTPYVLAMSGMGSIVDTAAGIVEMTAASQRPDVRARARVLDAVGNTTKSYAKALMAVAAGIGCFMLLTAFLHEVWSGGEAGAEISAQLDVSSPVLYAGAVLGLFVVLIFVAVTLSRLVQAGRGLIHDLRGQLGSSEGESADARAGSRDEPTGGEAEPAGREGGSGALSPLLGGGSPVGHRQARSELAWAGRANGEPAVSGSPEGPEGYLAYVEVVSRIALRGMVPLVVVGIGVPLLMAVALRLTAASDNVTSSAEALVALLLVATIAGAVGSLLFTSAGSAWDNAKKYIETGAHGGRYIVAGRNGEVDNPTYVAAVIGDTIGDPLKGSIWPATLALVKTLSTLALVFLPFFL